MNNLNNGLSEFSGNNVIDDLTHINSSKDLPHKENDEKELDDRNKIYSTILENYSKYLKDTLNSNKSNKQIFRYIKISIASNVAIKYKGDTPIKYYGDV